MCRNPVAAAALDVIVTRGASLEFGARYLKRVIDQTISLPISSRWQSGSYFSVRADGNDIVIEDDSRQRTVDLPGAA